MAESKELSDQNGSLATFLIYVRYRQRATWQGLLYQKEKDKLVDFGSELELIKEMDRMIS